MRTRRTWKGDDGVDSEFVADNRPVEDAGWMAKITGLFADMRKVLLVLLG
jgi:hypothetical protein